jgi:redox-sensitive bicupin YhaK (pirin superfamily)
MIHLRRSKERGHANHGWLDSRHTFSFADYYDPEHMHFRSLRVINEDHIAPGAGFPTHPHRDMEIITYVVSGAVAHKDTTGGAGVIGPGQLQYMCAGKGVQHSEFNASPSEPLHLLQIWILPEAKGLTPGYKDVDLSLLPSSGPLQLAVSPDGREGTVKINQDVLLLVGHLAENESAVYSIAPTRGAWIHLISGSLVLNGERLAEGDAAALSLENELRFHAEHAAHFLLFDLA